MAMLAGYDSAERPRPDCVRNVTHSKGKKGRFTGHRISGGPTITLFPAHCPQKGQGVTML